MPLPAAANRNERARSVAPPLRQSCWPLAAMPGRAQHPAPAAAGARPRAGQAGRVSRPRRRLHRLPHRSRRQAVRRRAADADAVRHALFLQHHARPGDRHRQLDRRPVLRAHAHRALRPMAGCSIPPCRSRPTPRSRARIRTRSSPICARSRRCTQPNRPHDLRFPYNNRSLILGWRTLFFNEGEYKPRPVEIRRVEPRRLSRAGARPLLDVPHADQRARRQLRKSQAFEGGLIPMQNWYAPSLTSNKEAGLGDWSIEDISDLLRTGVSQRGAVYGPMAEVVYNSLQYMTDDDTRAMAVYLKSLGQGSAAGRDRLDHAAGREQPADAPRQDGLRHAMRELPRRRRARHAARLSAARRQPVDPDGFGGEPDPHGAERRLSARHRRQSDAVRHAAFRAIAVRRRGRRRGHLSSASSWGNRGDAGLRRARPTSCARRRWIERRHDEHGSRPTTPRDEERGGRTASSRTGARGALALAGIATAIVIAMWFAFYLLVFVPARDRAMSGADRPA